MMAGAADDTGMTATQGTLVNTDSTGIDLRTVHLTEPLPGIPDLREFVLAPVDPDGILWTMRADERPGLRLVVSPPHVFFPRYLPVMPAELHRLLDCEHALDAQDGPHDELACVAGLELMLVLTITDGLSTATANLRAPLVLAEGGRRARQIVLDDDALSMREPLFRS